MEWSFLFFFNSALLGVGLAMDAFSVSMANGLHDPRMSMKRMCIIAGTFGLFQAVMPMTGWVCVHTVVELFSSFETFIPWIALILLAYIGGKMLMEGIKGEETEEAAALSAGALFVQGVATSIDALSVGFTRQRLYSLTYSHKNSIGDKGDIGDNAIGGHSGSTGNTENYDIEYHQNCSERDLRYKGGDTERGDAAKVGKRKAALSQPQSICPLRKMQIHQADTQNRRYSRSERRSEHAHL